MCGLKKYIFSYDYHPIEEEIGQNSLRNKKFLRRRFQIPPGMHLLGFETNFWGHIVPVFSPSKKFTEYRAMHFYPHYKSYDDQFQERSEKIAEIVDLLSIPHMGMVEEGGSFNALPGPLRKLHRENKTLTTPIRLSPELAKDAHPSPFSALMISSPSSGEGRVGVIMQDGIPLMTRDGEQEYIFEAKGIGLGSNYEGEIFVFRNLGQAKLGRTAESGVERELDSYRRLLSVHPFSPEELVHLPRPVVGVKIFEMIVEDLEYDKAPKENSKNLRQQLLFVE